MAATQLGETPGDNRPTPDPTVLTTEALERGLKSERDYVDGQFGILAERLRGIDKATEVVADGLANGPIGRSVQHLRELTDEKFASVALQFQERDVRSERESRDNTKAVDAAFAAQKEAAAKEGEANQKAIDKSERNTGDSIAAQGDKIEDVKTRVSALESRLVGIESLKIGAYEVTTSQQQATSGQRQNWGLIIAATGVASALILGLAGIVITLLLR